ncbi:2-amino-4-hydroxy-6-hydroxymethyldihydropteridine diphosphokinase [Candidatus Sumerlaeota bacterium]|nr:2-amino-4-hydroxy-6-hydroxymethyldihydropteridine diphosphokinase [Candidatus Sumerlaeota bacterium]
MTKYFAIALGSNIGDRLFYLNRALAMIDQIPGLTLLAASRIYESAGWGRDDLDPFLNAVVIAGSNSLDANTMLNELQRIEGVMGRQRDVHWGARTLDLDLLAVNDEVSTSPELTLPHPWICDRPFVYFPFREVAHYHAGFARLTASSEKGRAIEKDSKVTDLGAPVWGYEQEAWEMTGGDLESSALVAIEVTTTSERETEDVARTIAPYLLPGTVIALNAPMGSGKSVFARGVARALGIEGAISSPTYLLCKTYESTTVTLEHWDFYRLESRDDLESAGFSSVPPNTIRLIEWAEKFPDDVENAFFLVTITTPDPRRNPGARSLLFECGRNFPALPFAVCALLNQP